MKNLVIFDLDGTLIDSLLDLANATNYTLKYFNHNEVSVEHVKNAIGNGARKLIERCFPNYPDVNSAEIDEAMKVFIPYYNSHCNLQTTIYPGVIDFLKKLNSKNIDLAVLTNKPEVATLKILEALNLLPFFKKVIGGDTLKESKPSPMGLLKIIEDLNSTPEQALMIGDGIPDMACAQSAKVDSIAILEGMTSPEALKKFNPKYIVNNFNEINNLDQIEFRSSQ